MTKKLVLRSAARQDILDRSTYLAEQNAPAAALRFLNAVQEATAQIIEMPGIGSPRQFQNPRLSGLRSWPVPGFKAIRIYYLETDDAIRVVRVLHGMMDVAAALEDESG